MAGNSSSNRKYHSYQDLGPINKLYELPTSPEYLFSEQAAVQRRSLSENLSYYTGCGYLAGTVVGGFKGSIEGLRSAEFGETFKVRTNRVLNSGGHTGRRFENKLGVLGLIFSGLESTVLHYRGTDDLLNSVVAGLGTGALYRVTAGPRSAVIAGAFGGLVAGAAVVGKQASYYRVEMRARYIASFEVNRVLQRRSSSLISHTNDHPAISVSKEHIGLMSWPEHFDRQRQAHEHHVEKPTTYYLSVRALHLTMYGSTMDNTRRPAQSSPGNKERPSHSLSYPRVPPPERQPLVYAKSEGATTLGKTVEEQKRKTPSSKPPVPSLSKTHDHGSDYSSND